MQQIFPAAAGAPLTGAIGPGSPGLSALASLYAYPAGAGPVDADAGGALPGRPWVRANMVASVDGAASLAGRSGGLSGAADRQLFSVLRSLADVILVGAATAQAEKYRAVTQEEAWPELRAGRTPTPPIAVITRRLDLDPGSPLLTKAPADARTIVLTTEAAPAARRAEVARHADVAITGGEPLRLQAVIDALAERGHQRILLEGGPHLLGLTAAAGLLDELCLTVSPLLAGGQAGRILAGGQGDDVPDAQAGLELAHVLADDGFLFCRYVRRSSGPGATTAP
jgi:riboflavin biosynthesis pyrimidine reductase